MLPYCINQQGVYSRNVSSLEHSLTYTPTQVLIVELQSAAGNRELDAAAAAQLAEEGSDDGDWEEEPNPFLDLSTGLSKEQLMAYAANDGPQGRQRDDETQAFLVDFFKRAATTQEFKEEFQALTVEEQGRLRESAG